MENKTSKETEYKILLSLILCFFLLTTGVAHAEVTADDKTLIVYYSRTGKSKLVCDTLQQHIKNADILEVKDSEERYSPGRLGYYNAGFNSVLNRYTPIEPENPDFSTYSSIIIVSPVWNWKLSVPIRTLIHENRFEGKKMIFITTANNEVTKYENYGDEASFVKRYLRDFLRGKYEAMKSFVQSSGCEIKGFYHVATLEKTDKQIIEKTLSFVSDLKNKLSLDSDPSIHAAYRK